MSWWQYVLLLPAGVGGGLIGSVAGLASLISYPALLAVGLPPVTANVTNTVALVFSSAGSISASRVELSGQGPLMRRLAVAALAGGALGGALLLLAPADSFELVVPWLIGGASVAILAPRRRHPGGRPGSHARALLAGTGLVGVYGGYFGAAAGVLLLAVLLATTGETVARANAAKNVLLGLANGVAAVSFAVFGPVRWPVVVPLALGFFLGGRLGPMIVRRTPPTALRAAIAVTGVGLAVVLAWPTYS